jgi:hypothetical protein
MMISNIVFGLGVLCCTLRTIKLSSPVRLHLNIWCQYHHAQDSFYCVSLHNCTSLFLSLHCTECTIQIYTLQRKGGWESNINVWFPFMYSQKWNCYFQNRIIIICLSVPLLVYLWEIYSIYFQDQSAYSAAGKYVDQSWESINRSQTHECGNGLRLPNSQKRNT